MLSEHLRVGGIDMCSDGLRDSRGTMILLEGLDLAGKSTLRGNLIDHLRSSGFLVRHSRNALVSDNPIAKRADELRREDGAGLLETGALFLAAHLYDAKNFSYPMVGTYHVQDSSWLRTLAYHSIHGTRWIPELVRTCGVYQPNFDLVVYLTASIAVRRQRVLQRERESKENDKADYLPWSDPEKFVRNDQVLMEMTEEYYPACRVIDTSYMTPSDVLNEVKNFL